MRKIQLIGVVCTFLGLLVLLSLQGEASNQTGRDGHDPDHRTDFRAYGNAVVNLSRVVAVTKNNPPEGPGSVDVYYRTGRGHGGPIRRWQWYYGRDRATAEAIWNGFIEAAKPTGKEHRLRQFGDLLIADVNSIATVERIPPGGTELFGGDGPPSSKVAVFVDIGFDSPLKLSSVYSSPEQVETCWLALTSLDSQRRPATAPSATTP